MCRFWSVNCMPQYHAKKNLKISDFSTIMKKKQLIEKTKNYSSTISLFLYNTICLKKLDFILLRIFCICNIRCPMRVHLGLLFFPGTQIRIYHNHKPYTSFPVFPFLDHKKSQHHSSKTDARIRINCID